MNLDDCLSVPEKKTKILAHFTQGLKRLHYVVAVISKPEIDNDPGIPTNISHSKVSLESARREMLAVRICGE